MNLLVPVLGAFASGMFPALVASALVFYAALPGFSAGGLSLVASASFFGKVAASAFGGWLSDRMGRVTAIRLAGALSVLAALPLVLGGKTFASAVSGMGLEGFALGLFSILLPLHLIETHPVVQHGRSSAGYQFANTAGMLAGALVGMLVAARGAGSAEAIRMVFLSFVPVAVLFLTLSFGLKGEGRPSSSDPRQGPWLRSHAQSLFRAVALLSLTSAMGIGVIACSSVLLLQRAGLEGASANCVYLLTGFVLLAASGLSVLAQRRFSRLATLRIGCAGAAVSLVLMSVTLGRLPSCCFAAALLLYTGLFAFGPGAAAWTIAGEILPQEIRAKGMSLSILANQVVTAVLTAAFLPLAAHVGFAPVFLFFALAAVGYCFLVRPWTSRSPVPSRGDVKL